MTERASAALGMDKPPLSRVLAMLDRDGEEARVVGGAVRNALMGIPVGEVDIATTALPDEVVRRATAAGFKPVPTGIEHGTVTVVASGVPFEVTTLREDIETYGRKAKVAFGRDWQRDALRRDFTINALSMSRDGKVHDYAEGLPDIAARRVRFVGDPATRIAEDYLRILRLFRFHASYGEGALDPAGLAASIAAREGLETLSRERVRAELMKLLVAPGAAATLETMADAGLLLAILGGVPRVASFAKLMEIETTLDLPRDPVRGLAALAVAVTEDADRLSQRLRLFNVEATRLSSMADGWWRLSSETGENDARALLYRLGQAAYLDRALLGLARAGHFNAAGRGLATLPQRWTASAFPLKAADFMARGVAKGPKLGEALSKAEAAWIAAGFPADPASLDAIAAKYAQSS